MPDAIAMLTSRVTGENTTEVNARGKTCRKRKVG